MLAPQYYWLYSAGFQPAVFKDAGKDASATGTRQCFFNLPSWSGLLRYLRTFEAAVLARSKLDFSFLKNKSMLEV